MSIKFFKIEIPVFVRDEDWLHPEHEAERHLMIVRIVMGPDAMAKDAVEELARKLEQACDTINIGDDM